MKTKQWFLLMCLALCSLLALAAPVRADSRLIILCYHEVGQPDARSDDPFAVDARSLVRQMEWMRGQGYQFVSVEDVLADRAGKKPLPDKAVLLTFDDGYRSVYTQVYPVLRSFHAPALIALVGSWLEAADGEQVRYGDGLVPRSTFLSWAQIREMQASGLVEVASHSYAEHFGQLANPQGNSEPALTSLAWKAGSYETPEAYQARIRADLLRNSTLLKARLGRAPRVMVWPYGSYTRETAAIAGELGMPLTMSLDEGINTRQTPLAGLRRLLLDANMSLADLAWQFQQLETWPDGIRPEPSRIMHVDLDYIYDPDPARQEANLGRLLERVKAMGASTVYLQAFANPEGDGVARSLYFPNRHLPMRADLFNRAAWQLRTRVGVRVYAWMPLLAFDLPRDNPLRQQRVLALGRQGLPEQQGYIRLTPYSAEARQTIREIYQDLARSVQFDGLLFHDDATLSDVEDVSGPAMTANRAMGLPDSLPALRQDEAALQRWNDSKIKLLDDFTLELAQVVRTWQPTLKTARNLYAGVVMNPATESWFAQSYVTALQHYDRVAIMAMPYMENAAQPRQWLRQLFDKVKAVPGALDRTVFELQARDWRSGKPIPTREMAEVVEELHTLGARHIAYYPDDLFQDQPRLADFKAAFSMRSHPEQ
ncbi:poly-beta-1,6-N-acetyl-D-glucosamine N-deacetylase PgaB [Aquitalea palustris]|uniref:Poly-beta-1,6-N-acetyl-D-glucosamine N-deacetylase PgaB n=1 Tax=Aquitalea palustris TaxID=2480983 RepID=A0A454JDV0_9NEIS|nr:poly-beta-1,6-N-acetyl-D-glucosamine N-deacetylase PgaB [Aquitalea palustris]RMC91867.1 poly-beta-1,6-N-acetyl-D-glucosamine N-deacetylase PgaB [Aquitalea palustris]